MQLKSILILVILVLASALSAAGTGTPPLKILGLFPHPGASHFNFFRPIMRGLAAAGHKVDVVSHFENKEPLPGYTDYSLQGDNLTNTIDFSIFEKRNFLYHFAEFFLLYKYANMACNTTLNSQALDKVMKHPPGYYDVIILEQFNTDCMMAVAYKLQAPAIALSSCAMMPWHYERMGAPIIPSFISALFLGQSQKMSFGGRLANWITMHSFNWMYKLLSIPAANKIVHQKFGAGVPSVEELVKNTSLFFVNQHYSLSGPKPLPPNVIEIGGIHIEPTKKLPTDLQRLLDNATHGVILISWGSQLQSATLPSDKLNGILRAVARLEQQVVWKWENDTLPDKPTNLHIMKWLPQRDILCHPNLKVFMSHAGLMGTSEAAHCGVPVVATPMYGDQFVNTAALVQRGMAVELKYEDISEQTVFNSIKQAMDNQYKVNAAIVARSYNERLQTPLETALWWVEYVAASKGAPLAQPSAVHMSRFIYYSLDVYLVIGAMLLLFVVCWIKLIRLCRRSLAKPKLKQN